MKIINFGSMNIDRVYNVAQMVAPGETISAGGLHIYAGGKGLNQSVAAARAGAQVIHAGAVGPEGGFLVDALTQSGADAGHLLRPETETGHAVIQINSAGQNAIIVYGGANRCLDEAYIDKMLALGDVGDLVLLQNETSGTAEIIRRAHEKGLTVVFNPSPFPAEPLPYELVDLFIVNEIEGALLAELPLDTQPETILNAIGERFPNAWVVLTLGGNGVVCRKGGETFAHPIFKVTAVDTTAAGDTFCGYFLAGLCLQKDIPQCLKEASAASAIAVSRQGAVPSIPTRAEVEEFLAERK